MEILVKVVYWLNNQWTTVARYHASSMEVAWDIWIQNPNNTIIWVYDCTDTCKLGVRVA